ncbi:YcaO-like family protein [Thermosipho ferrireducens]|uniref:YcaO-like family protein n=1 Tax=Thermosipho ferrireducens TaxID=2571116 RepID=A0ABX7S631_9BACT|nr:YcaO-like family protein [Thermosipho ferrireducens]QTA37281.1 YcaO-like family protein [Thermosipho ferrireducens]
MSNLLPALDSFAILHSPEGCLLWGIDRILSLKVPATRVDQVVSVLKLFDGTHSIQQIASLVGIPERAVLDIYNKLNELGVIYKGNDVQQYQQPLQLEIPQHICLSSIVVVGTGLCATTFISKLPITQLVGPESSLDQINSLRKHTSVIVALADGPCLAPFKLAEKLARQWKIPWIAGFLYGGTALAATFLPGSGCLNCVLSRCQSMVKEEKYWNILFYALEKAGWTGVPVITYQHDQRAHFVLVDLVLRLLNRLQQNGKAECVINTKVGIEGESSNKLPQPLTIYRQDTWSNKEHKYLILPMFSCQHCHLPLSKRKSFVWQQALKLGLICELKSVDRSSKDPPLPFFVALGPAAHAFSPAKDAIVIGGALSITKEDAKMRAVAEALERYCGLCFKPDYLQSERYTKLGILALNPRLIALFTDEQYQMPDFPFRHPNDVGSITWVQGKFLLTGEPVLVPAQFVYIGYARAVGEPELDNLLSTGLAAGRSFEEATLNALLEVIERDAFMIAWLNKMQCPPLSCDILPEELTQILTKINDLELELRLWLLPTDVQVEVVCACIRDLRGRLPAAAFGVAASSTRSQAAKKATLEALMVRRSLQILLRHRSPETYRNFERIEHAVDSALLYTLPEMESGYEFLLESHTPPPPPKDRDDLTLNKLVNELSALGLQPIVVDITTKDVRYVGLHVVRVLVPGMQPLDVCYRARHLGGKRFKQMAKTVGWPCASSWNVYPQPLG